MPLRPALLAAALLLLPATAAAQQSAADTTPPLSAAARTRVLDALFAQLARRYVFPDSVPRIERTIRQRARPARTIRRAPPRRSEARSRAT